jgi:hypothetical protein
MDLRNAKALLKEKSFLPLRVGLWSFFYQVGFGLELVGTSVSLSECTTCALCNQDGQTFIYHLFISCV